MKMQENRKLGHLGSRAFKEIPNEYLRSSMIIDGYSGEIMTIEEKLRRTIDNSIHKNATEALKDVHEDFMKEVFGDAISEEDFIKNKKLITEIINLKTAKDDSRKKEDEKNRAERGLQVAKSKAWKKVTNSDSILGFVKAAFAFFTNTDEDVKIAQEKMIKAQEEFWNAKSATIRCFNVFGNEIANNVDEAGTRKPKSTSVAPKIKKALEPAKVCSPSPTPRTPGTTSRRNTI